MRIYDRQPYARYAAFFGLLSLGCAAVTMRSLADGERPREMIWPAVMAAAFGLATLFAVRRALAVARGYPAPRGGRRQP